VMLSPSSFFFWINKAEFIFDEDLQ
jgi:hypothetical protein